MPYLESFIYYIAVVGTVFIVLYLTIVVTLFLLGQIKLFFSIGDHGNFNFQDQKSLFLSIVKHKFLKLFIIFYVASFSFFYVNKAFEYYGEDRAYPKAKSYKIVADVVAFNYGFFISSRNLYFRPSGLQFIEAYQKIQKHLMQKGFQYIPQEDAERAIWKYEYYYADYVKARTAPIDFEALDEDNLKWIVMVGNHPTKYKLSAQKMLYEIDELVDALMKSNIKDKTYSEINRYAVFINLITWWEHMDFLYHSLGGETVDKYYENTQSKLELWTKNQKYLQRTEEVINWLNRSKEHIDGHKKAQSFFTSRKYLYPDMMALRVGLQSKLTYADLLYTRFSCNMKMLQNYFKVRKEFVYFAKTNMAFQQLSLKEHRHSKALVDYEKNFLLVYILSHYCEIPKKKLIYKENIEYEWDLKETLSTTKKILKRIENE